MAQVTADSALGYRKPLAGETVRLPVFLRDSDGVAVTGVAFDAAGVEVLIAKPGAAYVAWATIVGAGFATGNWFEKGKGSYSIILSGDVAGQANLLDTGGDVEAYVKFTATKGDVFLFRCVGSDVVRVAQWPDEKAAFLDASVAAANNGTPPTAAAIAALVLAGATPLADIIAAILLDPTHPLATDAAGAVTAANAVVEADLLAGIEAGTVAGVTGDVDGKVLGGGSGTITGIGAWCAGAGGAAVALASKLLTFVQSLARKDVAADAEIAGTFASATDSLEAQADALAVALPGDGAFAITLTAKVDGVATLGVRVRLQASGGSTYQDSTADGTVHFNRDAAASPGLWCRVAGNGLWEDFTVQVVISPTGVVTAPVGGVLALVGIALPAATDPTRCRCYLDMLQAGADAAVGATLGKLAVTGINTRPAGDTHVYSCDEMADDTGGYTDASGRAYLDIPRGMVCWVQATYPDTGDVTKQVTVPSAASYDMGSVFPGYVAAP
jgi:hypothetical protein